MIKPYERKLLLKIVLILISFALLGWLYITHYYALALLLSAIILYQLYDIFYSQKRVYTELEQFKESINYRDFSRHFDIKSAPSELRPLREAFNLIGDSFKEASKEKETQYQYLQQILAMVNTGILSFELSSGEIIWMNEAVKNMLNLPHMKNIVGLKKRNIVLLDTICNIPVGESKLLNLQQAKSQNKILLSATIFKVNQQQFKLITFQNISEAIEETEADAWSRLLRVMTHEIMNSIAPISSLASTLSSLVDESIKNKEPQPSYVEDLMIGIETIGKRSEALLKFADTYRNLNKITTLNLEKVYIRDLFESQSNLMTPTLSARNIELEIILKDPSIQVEVDRSLLEQVMINLLVNAIEAVKERENPKIALTAALDVQKRCVIQVNDNGNGIPPDLLDKIFVPFFSTKKNGSGIGLNLCKQIITLHKGSLNVKTIEGAGSSFYLTI